MLYIYINRAIPLRCRKYVWRSSNHHTLPTLITIDGNRSQSFRRSERVCSLVHGDFICHIHIYYIYEETTFQRRNDRAHRFKSGPVWICGAEQTGEVWENIEKIVLNHNVFHSPRIFKQNMFARERSQYFSWLNSHQKWTITICPRWKGLWISLRHWYIWNIFLLP